MKKLIIITLAIMSISHILFAQKVTIKGNVSNSPDPSVSINTPLEGLYFSGQNAEVKSDNSGNYQYTFDVKTPGFATVINNFYPVVLYIEPNQTYEVNYSKNAEPQIKGYNASAQMLINSLGVGQEPKMEIEDLSKVKGASAKIEFAKKAERQKLQQVEDAYKNKLMTEQMYNALKSEVENLTSLLLSTDFFFTYREDYEEKENGGALFMNEYGDAWTKLYDDMAHSKTFLSSPGLPRMMVYYCSFSEIKNTGKLDFSQSGVSGINDIKLYKENIKGNLLESAWANAIIEGISANRFEPEWEENFVEFKKTFPQSKFTSSLSPYIQAVITYNDNLTKNNPNVKFLEGLEKAKTLKEVFAKLKGQVTYVDFWATWCSPCRKEMQYSKSNHKELAKFGVQTAYISIDKDADHNAWKSMAKSLSLEGLNGRVNAAVNKELYKSAPQFKGIPYYVILDKEGNPIVWSAKRPSEKNDLFEQIREVVEKNTSKK